MPVHDLLSRQGGYNVRLHVECGLFFSFSISFDSIFRSAFFVRHFSIVIFVQLVSKMLHLIYDERFFVADETTLSAGFQALV